MRRHLLFFFLLFAGPLTAQQYDLWQWTSISIDKKVTDKIGLSIDEEIRLYHNLADFNLSYTNLGINYKFSKNVKTAFLYRFTQKRLDDGSFSFRHRLLADLVLKTKARPFILSYRFRLQSQLRDIYSSDDGAVPESYWRNKFDVKLDLNKKITPYISAEFRFQFANVRLQEANYTFNRGRYYLGFDYALSKNSTLGFYNMLQWEYNVNDPERDYVIGISYGLEI